jgi:hypothetical protein
VKRSAKGLNIMNLNSPFPFLCDLLTKSDETAVIYFLDGA